MTAALEGRGLTKSFPASPSLWASGISRRVVDHASLAIGESETVGLVGESGSGKSTLGRLLIRLLEPDSGLVYLEGEDITELSGERLRARRRKVQVVFQDAGASLNSRWTVAQNVRAPLDALGVGESRARSETASEMLEAVSLSRELWERRPHELSGGQQQRAAIARALVLRPKVLIADEPVSGLDVSVQAQVLNLLLDIRDQMQLAMLFISHDLAVVDYLCSRVVVMKDGRILEDGPTEDVLADPRAEYTARLLEAVPNLIRKAPASGTRHLDLGDGHQ